MVSGSCTHGYNVCGVLDVCKVRVNSFAFVARHRERDAKACHRWVRQFEVVVLHILLVDNVFAACSHTYARFQRSTSRSSTSICNASRTMIRAYLRYSAVNVDRRYISRASISQHFGPSTPTDTLTPHMAQDGWRISHIAHTTWFKRVVVNVIQHAATPRWARPTL